MCIVGSFAGFVVGAVLGWVFLAAYLGLIFIGIYWGADAVHHPEAIEILTRPALLAGGIAGAIFGIIAGNEVARHANT